MNEERVVCAVCGAVPGPGDDARLTWSFAVERGRESWTCPQCTRQYARGIEARLDADWW